MTVSSRWSQIAVGSCALLQRDLRIATSLAEHVGDLWERGVLTASGLDEILNTMQLVVPTAIVVFTPFLDASAALESNAATAGDSLAVLISAHREVKRDALLFRDLGCEVSLEMGDVGFANILARVLNGPDGDFNVVAFLLTPYGRCWYRGVTGEADRDLPSGGVRDIFRESRLRSRGKQRLEMVDQGRAVLESLRLTRERIAFLDEKETARRRRHAQSSDSGDVGQRQ
jgi:hypothetical protein